MVAVSHNQLSLPLTFPMKVIASSLLKRKRSFRLDACNLMLNTRGNLRIIDNQSPLKAGRTLFVTNHYSAPGFSALWIAIALAAAIPQDVHWVMTSAWTFPHHPLRKVLRRVSEQALRRIALVYDFTLMPPMPPDPREADLRAIAIRELFSLARKNPALSFALVPEGRDFPGGILGEPPAGVGRFIFEFSKLGFEIQPVGFYSDKKSMILNFGKPFIFQDIDYEMPKANFDAMISQKIMTAIAQLLPVHLRGQYG